MATRRHEIPTHLGVEDKILYGLSVHQFLFVTVGLAGGYGLWNQWPELAVPPRLAVSIAWLLVALALALVRPAGRGLDQWAFVALRYLALPKTSIWRPREPDPAQWRPPPDRWASFEPSLAWRGWPDGVEPDRATPRSSIS
jgi:hypothetical protein